MKSLFVLCGLLVSVSSSSCYALVQQDSLKQDTIYITPYFAKTHVNSVGNFAFVKKDPYAFQTYAGSSVLNTLRGHIPNLSIGPNANEVKGGPRNAFSMLVIDGLPFTSAVYPNYNLNTFEYENIYVLSSGNAVSSYGGVASDGAIFLQSKTGKNLFKPTIEINSSPTFIWEDPTMLTPEVSQWWFTNAIAYAQDFGTADMRISYSSTFLPEGSLPYETTSGFHNLKINTGVDFTKQLTARIILDGVYRKTNSYSGFDSQGQAIPLASTSTAKTLQGNLVLKYQASDWLTFTSQSALAGIRNDTHSISTITSQEKLENDRSFINLFASLYRTLNHNFKLTAFIGKQNEHQPLYKKKERTSPTMQSGSSQEYKYKTKSLSGGAGLHFRNYWFTNLNYRTDQFGELPFKESKPGYSVTSSFVFSEAFHWSTKKFSFGKVRVSYGKASVPSMQSLPLVVEFNLINGLIPNPQLSPFIKKKMVETGADMAFFNQRLTLNFSYFHDVNDQTFVFFGLPGGANSGYYAYLNAGKMHVYGWEMVLSGNVLNKNQLSLNTVLTWSTSKKYIDPEFKNAYTLDPTFGAYANPRPDWTGSVLNQFTLKNFFGTFLIDVRKGGDYLIYDPNEGDVSGVDPTTVKLRDLSIGFIWPGKQSTKSIIRQGKISLSGRNLWTIHSKIDYEFDLQQYLYVSQKSASVSLTLLF